MSCSYYIYYRVDPAHTAIAALRTGQVLDRVRTCTAVSGRIMKKRGEPNLWMEVYENIKDSSKFEQMMQVAVKELNAIEFLQAGSGRHMECFEE